MYANELKEAKAIIFDMDGLLIDSEPYWKIAEKEVFGSLGLQLTDDLLRQVMGFRLTEVIQYWYTYQPWENPDFSKTELVILQNVKDKIMRFAEPLPGVFEVIAFGTANQIPMAIASSSPMELIMAVVEKLGIEKDIQVFCSGSDEPYGKPHPGTFITAARKLGIKPEDCLVLEDSINGVIAAKAARMKCIAIPETATFNDPRFAIADMKVPTATNLFTATRP